MNQIQFATATCMIMHRNQRRKYTNEPYFYHPVRVAKLARRAGLGKDAIIAALLHDTIEDTAFTWEDVDRFFGGRITSLVLGLTKPSTLGDGSRAIRTRKDKLFLAIQCPLVKSIKLADLYDNTKSIAKHDPDFAKIYLREKAELLEVLKEGHPGLLKMCYEQLEKNNVPY